jgi:hypothetical protein
MQKRIKKQKKTQKSRKMFFIQQIAKNENNKTNKQIHPAKAGQHSLT